jgi:succinyldiaminopimelate transaminase
MNSESGFVPPPYPYDRLNRLLPIANAHPGGVVDFSIGTPVDPAPPEVVAMLSASDSERGYPASIGSERLRGAVGEWMRRRLGVDVPSTQIAACIGTKEFVATLPQLMSLRTPNRDTVLYPEISYPTYAMGAQLARLRAVPVPATADGRMDLTAISASDAARALLLWVNSPGNPTGTLDDLEAAAAWGRHHQVPVFSDECYVEFTWSSRPRTILEHGTAGLIAVHSLSKRSNLAGVRVGAYAGDADIVQYLQEVRKHMGMMVPGPAQAAGVVALGDDVHVDRQREIYHRRLVQMAEVISDWAGIEVTMPDGAFYLWIPVQDGWEFTEKFARDAGALVSPGEFYGPAGSGFVRLAVVQPDEQVALVIERLRSAS